MGIRGRLILLVFGVFAAMFAISLTDLYRTWRFNRVQLTDSLKKRTELAAVAFDQWTQAQEEPLETIAELAEDKSTQSVVIETNLLSLLDTRPTWQSLQIVDEKGNKLFNYNERITPPKSLIDDLLDKIREKGSWVLTTDRSTSETRPIFTIATPTRNGGAVIVQIDGEAVKELFNDIELAENSVVAVIGKDGRILYRRVSGEVSVSSEIVGSSLIEALGNEKIAVAEIESPYDGITRVYGLARNAKSENVVVIGIDSKRFYAPLWNQIYRQLKISVFIFLIAIAVALFLAYSIMKSLKNLRETTYRFAVGNRYAKAPTNVAGEIGELGKAFNSMAEQINEREDRLKELDDLKSEFVSSVSHELKTPLTTIKTLTHVLKENKITEKEKADYLDVIAAECDRQIILVTNILDVSQIEAGKYQYESSEVNLKRILEEVYKIEKPAAELKNNSLELAIEEDLPAVSGNAEALHRVFRSLVENAIKYTPESGSVKITARGSADEIGVSVSDNGSGIAAQDMPYIFEKFYRGNPNSDSLDAVNQTSGVGLGLYITKKIVEQLGGKIVAGNGLAGGTIFTVYLPVWKEKNGEKIINS